MPIFDSARGIALQLTINHPERFRATVLGGVGGEIGGMGSPGRTESIVKALLAEDKSEITETVPRTFRDFAEANRNDLKALAACMSRPTCREQPGGAQVDSYSSANRNRHKGCSGGKPR